MDSVAASAGKSLKWSGASRTQSPLLADRPADHAGVVDRPPRHLGEGLLTIIFSPVSQQQSCRAWLPRIESSWR